MIIFKEMNSSSTGALYAAVRTHGRRHGDRSIPLKYEQVFLGGMSEEVQR